MATTQTRTRNPPGARSHGRHNLFLLSISREVHRSSKFVGVPLTSARFVNGRDWVRAGGGSAKQQEVRMEFCLGCQQELFDHDNVVDIGADLGGGIMHRACWNELLPWIKKLCNEVGVSSTPAGS